MLRNIVKICLQKAFCLLSSKSIFTKFTADGSANKSARRKSRWNSAVRAGRRARSRSQRDATNISLHFVTVRLSLESGNFHMQTISVPHWPPGAGAFARVTITV